MTTHDIFWVGEDAQHPMRLAGFKPTGGVQAGPDSGTLTWLMGKDLYTLEVAFNLNRGDNATLALVTFKDDKRHPIGFTATGWDIWRVIETAEALADFRARRDRDDHGGGWWNA